MGVVIDDDGRWHDTDTGQFIEKGDVSSLARLVANQLSPDNKEYQIQQAAIQARMAQSQELQEEVPMEDWERNYFLNADLSTGGMVGAYRNYMRSHGVSEDNIEKVRQMLSAHSGYNYEEADKQIVAALESDTPLGDAFRVKIQFEEALYRTWIKYQSTTEEPWRKKVYDGKKLIFRKGKRKSGIEPWTTDEDGADMGYGGIGYDHRSTVEDLFKEGYNLLGGAGLHHGSPGEGEMTFVKYNRRKK